MSDAADLRDALRLVPYGLYVLTSGYGAEVNAITCNWMTQVSFSPVLVTVAIEKQSHTQWLIRESGVFVLNLLNKESVALSRRMAVPTRINPFKLAGVDYHTGMTGAPILDEALAVLECEVRQTLEVGDHVLFVGEVVAGGVIQVGDPLTLLESGLKYK